MKEWFLNRFDLFEKLTNDKYPIISCLLIFLGKTIAALRMRSLDSGIKSNTLLVHSFLYTSRPDYPF